MKIFAVFIGIVIFGDVYSEPRCTHNYIGDSMILTQALKTELEGYCDECMIANDVQLADLERVERELPADAPEGVMCYYECWLKRYGSMTADGRFIADKVRHTMPEENLKAFVSCVPEAETYENHCERAFRGYVCYLGKATAPGAIVD